MASTLLPLGDMEIGKWEQMEFPRVSAVTAIPGVIPPPLGGALLCSSGPQVSTHTAVRRFYPLSKNS